MKLIEFKTWLAVGIFSPGLLAGASLAHSQTRSEPPPSCRQTIQDEPNESLYLKRGPLTVAISKPLVWWNQVKVVGITPRGHHILKMLLNAPLGRISENEIRNELTFKTPLRIVLYELNRSIRPFTGTQLIRMKNFAGVPFVVFNRQMVELQGSEGTGEVSSSVQEGAAPDKENRRSLVRTEIAPRPLLPQEAIRRWGLGLLSVHQIKPLAWWDQTPIDLTRDEYEVLQLALLSTIQKEALLDPGDLQESFVEVVMALNFKMQKIVRSFILIRDSTNEMGTDVYYLNPNLFAPLAENPPILQTENLVLYPDSHTAVWKGSWLILSEQRFWTVYVLASSPGRVLSPEWMQSLVKRRLPHSDLSYPRHLVSLIRKQFRTIDADFDEIQPVRGKGYTWVPFAK